MTAEESTNGHQLSSPAAAAAPARTSESSLYEMPISPSSSPPVVYEEPTTQPDTDSRLYYNVTTPQSGTTV